MSKPTTIGQSHNAMSVLANNADWDAIDSASLQRVIDDPREAGKHFTAFIKNGGRVIVGEQQIVALQPSKFFNPSRFIDDGHTIEEEDRRSYDLTQIDLTAIHLVSMLHCHETMINGEKKLERLKDVGHIRLDARWLQFLFENQHLIPNSWKQSIDGNTMFIDFDGTVIRGPNMGRLTLSLYWCINQWMWGSRSLHSQWSRYHRSAVLLG